VAVTRLPAATKYSLKVALNAYSFNKPRNAAIRRRGERTTLIKLLEFAAKNRATGAEVQAWISAALHECANYGKKFVSRSAYKRS
jgi:hypothetical protein